MQATTLFLVLKVTSLKYTSNWKQRILYIFVILKRGVSGGLRFCATELTEMGGWCLVFIQHIETHLRLRIQVKYAVVFQDINTQSRQKQLLYFESWLWWLDEDFT